MGMHARLSFPIYGRKLICLFDGCNCAFVNHHAIWKHHDAVGYRECEICVDLFRIKEDTILHMEAQIVTIVVEALSVGITINR